MYVISVNYCISMIYSLSIYIVIDKIFKNILSEVFTNERGEVCAD